MTPETGHLFDTVAQRCTTKYLARGSKEHDNQQGSQIMDTPSHTAVEKEHVAGLMPTEEFVRSMSRVAPTILSPEAKAMFAKADNKLLERIQRARDRGDNREVRNLIKLRNKSRAAFFATASKVKKRQRMRKALSDRTTTQLAVDTFLNEGVAEVKVFALRKPDGDGLRIVCGYEETDTVRQLILKDSIYAAHRFHEHQFSIQKRSRHHALERIAQILKSGIYRYCGELDSTNHFVMINPSKVVERLGIDGSVRDEVITNRRKEIDGKIVLTNSLAKANRALAISHATRGLPQGAASSSAIASASITDVIERFCVDWENRAALINYADNFYLFTQTQADWEKASQDLIARFGVEEGLTLRVRSPCRDLNEGLDLLGFTVILEKDQPIIRPQRARYQASVMALRRKMHELLAAAKRGNTMLDQIYYEAVSEFINRVAPIKPASFAVCRLMEFFGAQLLDFGERNDVESRDLVRLARFCKKHYPSRESLEDNVFGN